MEVFIILTVIFMKLKFTSANIRCFSCAPCTEFDYYGGWTDHSRWEMDCPLDRYCLKVSGTVVDAYGYGRQVAVRGCPLISLITRLEEGCHSKTLDVTGVGRITGEVCLCDQHLCNQASRQAASWTLTLVISTYIFILRS